MAAGRTWGLTAGVAAAVGALTLIWPTIAPTLRDMALDLYRLGGTLNAVLAGPVSALRARTGVSLLTPFLLGLLAATAPCQLSTGVATLAYVARDGHAGGAWPRSLAFLLARMLVYLALGAVAVFAFGGTLTASGDFFTGVRRVLGPLMFSVGLVMLGVVRPRFTVGMGLAERFEVRARLRRDTLGAFALGLAFSLAFCPTLFLLYFGLTLPLAVTAPVGALYPVAFVLGMMLPLLLLVALLPAGRTEARRTYLGHLRQAHRLATPLAGAAFLLTGLLDTFIYWLL